MRKHLEKAWRAQPEPFRRPAFIREKPLSVKRETRRETFGKHLLARGVSRLPPAVDPAKAAWKRKKDTGKVGNMAENRRAGLSMPQAQGKTAFPRLILRP